MNGERFRWLGTRVRRLLRRGRQEAELDAEMQFHLDQLTAEFRAEGMSEGEARQAARREFGTAEVYREETRDAWRPPGLADLWRSVRFAGRSLARSPGFTLVAVLTLALGIGANTAMFSVMHEILLRPLPYRDSEQLDNIVRVTAQNPKGLVSVADYIDLLAAPGVYDQVAAFVDADMSLAAPGRPAEFARGLRVSANFFATAGVLPGLGRDFRADEETPGRNRVLVISHRCWVNRFGGVADIVGRAVRVDGEPHEIIGVLPESFSDWRYLGWIDLFRPLGLSRDEITDRRTPALELMARRAPAVSAAEASGFVAQFGERLATDHPDENAGASWRAIPLEVVKSGDTAAVSLTMLIGLSGFVLLIACSNLANLLLARTMARAREFALRAALGASRLQLLRPLIFETLLLALAGGVGAVLVALWGTDWLTAASTDDQGVQVIFPLVWSVLGWAFVVSLITALAFGLAPALFAMRLDLNATLKSGARGTTGDRGHLRLRQGIIIGQFALATVLLTGAILFVRGLDDLNNSREGWESDDLVTGTVLLPETAYATPVAIIAFQQQTLQRLAALPGAQSVSLSYTMPFFGWAESRKFRVEGQEIPESGREPAAVINGVSADYFVTVGTRLLAGRMFDARDTADAPRVFVINQNMAENLFGEASALGRRLAWLDGGALKWGEIVGVVRDVRSVFPGADRVRFQLYQPLVQEPRLKCEIAVRTAGVAPSALVTGIRKTVTEIDPDLPLRKLTSANARIERANYQVGVLGGMLTSFAVLGLALSSLGIYGAIARTMAQRTSEFGIRLALGAEVRDIKRLVLMTGVKLSLVGSGIGLFGAIGVTRLMAAGFPRISQESAPVIVVVTVLLLGVALVASYLPARNAGRINLCDALRAD